MNLSPLAVQKFFDNNGRPLVGGLLFTYAAGTSTKIATYLDEVGAANSNPIVLDFRGECRIWLDPALTYKFVLSPPGDTDPPGKPIWTADNIAAGMTASEITQQFIGERLWPRTQMEISAGVIPENYAYPPGNALRYGYIPDGAHGADVGTDNTDSIAAALASNYVVVLPAGTAMFEYIEVPPNRTIIGEGERVTILRQFSTSTGDPVHGAAMVFLADASTDISDKPRKLTGFCLNASTHCHGIYIGPINASMLDFSNLRIWNQFQETLTTPPYGTPAGKRGIFVEAGGVGSVFVAALNLVEIRSFDIAVEASGGVNEWQISASWFIDCRIGVRLSTCSTWSFYGLTVETAVSAARAFQLFFEVSNLLISGGRWELTRPISESGGCWGIEGDGSVTGSNIRISAVNVLIDGDGGAIPGRKWTGTFPNDMLFDGYDNIGGSAAPFTVVPNQTPMRMPNIIDSGGSGLGNGRVRLGRNSGGATASVGNTDSGELELLGGNSAFVGAGGVSCARYDDTVAAGSTRMLLWDVDKGALSRVTVGANDSGGSGFKLLRVPN